MRIILGKFLFLILSSSWLLGYHFTMKTNNHTPMLGEKTILTLHFSYNNIEEYEIAEPDFENFNIKPIDDKEYQDNNGTWHALLRYTLTAQKAGTFILPPLTTHIEMIKIKYQHLYNKNKYLKKFDIQTNALTIQVIPLPQSLKVLGKYELFAHVDNITVNAGEPVQFHIFLKGEGNIKSLDFLTLDIPNVMVYSTMINTYEKKFTLISDHNFSIPPVRLKYFDQESKEVTLLSTDAFFITITHPTNSIQIPTSLGTYLLIFLLFLFVWYLYVILSTLACIDEKSYLKAQLKQSKNKEDLLKKVVPYLNQNRQLSRLIYKLEEIEASEFKKLKKEILTYF